MDGKAVFPHARAGPLLSLSAAPAPGRRSSDQAGVAARTSVLGRDPAIQRQPSHLAPARSSSASPVAILGRAASAPVPPPAAPPA